MKKFALMGIAVALAWTASSSEVDAGHRHRAKRGGNSQQACAENYQVADPCCYSGYTGNSGNMGMHTAYHSGSSGQPSYGSYSNIGSTNTNYGNEGYSSVSQPGCGCGSPSMR